MKFRFAHGDRPLDGYTVLRGVGRGGFGEVYFALSDGGREVALKAILHHADTELRGVGQCINLKSPHLVSIFDVRHDETGTPFVIMEYVDGPSLRDILRRHPGGLPPAAAVFLARGIASGLEFLHSSGVVHRDLKPENIFIEGGIAKIGDYGLAKFMSASRHSGQTISVGTVHYMAPEIGSGNYSGTIDIYAFGVILYEILTGEVPFTGDSFGEVLMKHLTTAPDLSRVPEPFRAVVAAALEKDPARRPESVETLLAPLVADETLRREAANLDMSSFAVAGGESSTGADARPGGAVAEPDERDRPADATPLDRALRAVDGVVRAAGEAAGAAVERVGVSASRSVDMAVRSAGESVAAALDRSTAARVARSAPPSAPSAGRARRALSAAASRVGAAGRVVGRCSARAAACSGRTLWRGTRSMGRGMRRSARAVAERWRRRRAIERPPGAIARIFLGGVGMSLLVGAIVSFTMLFTAVESTDDRAVALIMGMVCAGLAGFSFYRGQRAWEMGLWRRTLAPLLTTVVLTLVAICLGLVVTFLDGGLEWGGVLSFAATPAIAIFLFGVTIR